MGYLDIFNPNLTTSNPNSGDLAEQAASAFRSALPNLGKAVIVLLFGIVIIRLTSWAAQAFIGLVRMPKGLKGILISIVDAMLWVFLVIVFLKELGLGEIALVFSGSIAVLGLALAGGASTLAADILAGIFLAKDRDFNVGDEVIAGENKTQGIIDGMDMRRTRLRAEDGNLHIIPNSVIERKEWVLLAKKKDR